MQRFLATAVLVIVVSVVQAAVSGKVPPPLTITPVVEADAAVAGRYQVTLTFSSMLPLQEVSAVIVPRSDCTLVAGDGQKVDERGRLTLALGKVDAQTSPTRSVAVAISKDPGHIAVQARFTAAEGSMGCSRIVRVGSPEQLQKDREAARASMEEAAAKPKPAEPPLLLSPAGPPPAAPAAGAAP